MLAKSEDLHKSFKVIILQDGIVYPEDKKRLALSQHLIGKSIGQIEQAVPVGKSALARLFSMVYLGDMVSVYLAFLYATDPTPCRTSITSRNAYRS